MLWTIVSIVGGLIGLVVLAALVFWVLGKKIPEEHKASVTMTLEKTPEEVFIVIDDVASQPSWDPGTNKVEKLGDRSGREAFRLTCGRNSFVVETTTRVVPKRITRTIADDAKFFSGEWAWELTPSADRRSCTVKLTETGRVPHAIPRAMMKHFFGYHHYMEKTMGALAAKFGEQARFTRG